MSAPFNLTKKEPVYASLVIVCALIIFFYRTIFLGRVPTSIDILSYWPLFNMVNVQVQNNLLSDVITQFEPWMWFSSLCVHNLQLPLWNPYCATGVPHLGNIQTTLFFFPTWPIYIFGLSKYTLLFYYFTKLYLIGISTYLYLRVIKLGFYPSLIGSIAFMFANFNVSWLYHPISNVIILLPAMFYLIEKLISREGDLRQVLLVALVTAIGIFAGHPETFFHIMVLCLGYISLRLVTEPFDLSKKIRLLRNYFLSLFLGAGIASVQLLPFVEYLLNSYAWASRESRYMLDWHMAILNLIPEFYGSPSIYYKFSYLPHLVNYNESASGYIGITLIILAIFAIVSEYKSNIVKTYLILSALCVCIIYGVPYIFDFVLSLPFFSSALNFRLLFFVAFSISVLGSIGLDRLLKYDGSRKINNHICIKYILSVAAVIAILVFLIYFNESFLYFNSSITADLKHYQNVLIFLTVAQVIITSVLAYSALASRNAHLKNSTFIGFLILIFIETGFHGIFLLPAVDDKYFYPDSGVFDQINSGHELYRATSIDPYASVYLVNTQMVYGIYDIRNYDALNVKYYWNMLKSFSDMQGAAWTYLRNVDEGFLDFLGVKWIFSRNDLSKDLGIYVTRNDDLLGDIVNGSVVEQEFRSMKPNLSEIELFFSTYGRTDSKLAISIALINASDNREIRKLEINSSSISDNQWYAVEFTPINSSSNCTYILRLRCDGPIGNGIGLWINKGNSDVPSGNLSLNGVHISGNLCFKTYYSYPEPFKLVKKYPSYYLLENSNPLPRAFLVQNATYRATDDQILQALKERSFRWNSSVILLGDGNPILLPKARNKLEIVDYDTAYICIKVASDQSCFLVLSDSYYPGWNAYINKTKVNVIRANYAFRAVELPPGTSLIEFKYEPMSVYVGSLITSISLMLLILLFKNRFRTLT